MAKTNTKVKTKREKKKKNDGEKGVLVYLLLLLLGTALLLYPSVSNYYNSFHQSKAISEYVQITSQIDEAKQEQLVAEAKKYNKRLLSDNGRWKFNDEKREEYDSILDISGTGIMGYIEIPKIGVALPVYHGTSNEVLQIAIGHVEGSSFPVGGVGTHSVLSGHRGLPSAKLFTDLDKMEVGDNFYIRILNDVLTYEVDQILIVLPREMDSLEIDPEQDYCTLVTCTPYGVNTHRMLVRGHRVETENVKTLIITSEALQIEPRIVMPFIALPICIIYVIALMLKPKRKK